MSYLFFAVLGYLVGSIMFSYLLPLWIKGIDITEDTSDGNPGAFNCIDKAGKQIGIFALACDILKGTVPILVAAWVLDIRQWAFVIVLIAPVLGHCFPVFRMFRGGKAISVTFGVLLGLVPFWPPLVILEVFYLTFSLILIIEPHRIRSILTFILFGVGVLIFCGWTPVSLGCVLISSIVVMRHLKPEEQEECVSAQFVIKRRAR